MPLPQNPARSISAIDKDIDANHRELRRRRRVKQLCAESWQCAWDLEPELQARDHDLFRERGLAQRARDMAWKPVRTPRVKKCPTCKGIGRLASAPDRVGV